MADKDMTFEKAIARLEEIVARLEGGQEPLEATLKLFEEGAALTAFCTTALKNAEQKIEQLNVTASAAAPIPAQECE